MRLLKRLAPWLQDKEIELNHASRRVSISIDRYRDVSRELQEEIQRNNFSKYLIYEKGE